jgi:hypothetical protein
MSDLDRQFQREVRDLSEAVFVDLMRRHWERAVVGNRAIRKGLPAEDQVMQIPPLETLWGSNLERGSRAWRQLFAFLCCVASLDEVAAVAPDFAFHLKSAAECLVPFMRAARKAEDLDKSAGVPMKPPADSLLQEGLRAQEMQALAGASICQRKQGRDECRT